MLGFKYIVPVCIGLLLVGCGSDSSSARAACGTAPCGGDLVGVWNIGVQCGESSNNDGAKDDENEDCPDATSSVNSYSTGRYTFNADGTYELTSSFQIALRTSTPASCIPMGAMCTDLGETEGDCTQASTAAPCVCNLSRADMDTEQGSYEVVDNTVTFIGDDGESVKSEDFCVKGSVLVLGDEQVLTR